MGLIPKLLSLVLLVGGLGAAVAMAGEPECDSPYKGRKLTPEELATVLRNHQAGLESVESDGRLLDVDDERRANLCQADLAGADLRRADLRVADLQGATLAGANLQGADLAKANLQDAYLAETKLQGADLAKAKLQGADLVRAKLQKANLAEANLRGASLYKADLHGARLTDADLHGARLTDANLQKARLVRAKLQGADLTWTDLAEAVYEPDLEKLPLLWTLTHPDNHLEKLVFHNTPTALMALREAFKRAGMRTQERQLTYAIEHTKQLHAWNPSWYKIPRVVGSSKLVVPGSQGSASLERPANEDPRPWLEQLAGKSESLFSYVLFELPSGYGLAPSRALATLGFLILVFALVYMVALLTARGRAGIWVTWPADRVYQEEGAKEATRVTTAFFFPRVQARAAGRWWGVLLRGVCLPLIGLYFSLLSAFSLGWREMNVGTWIARVQSREYVLRATGWVRTVSGLQSLLSVYLLALWVLTYFGRPFE